MTRAPSLSDQLEHFERRKEDLELAREVERETWNDAIEHAARLADGYGHHAVAAELRRMKKP